MLRSKKGEYMGRLKQVTALGMSLLMLTLPTPGWTGVAIAATGEVDSEVVASETAGDESVDGDVSGSGEQSAQDSQQSGSLAEGNQDAAEQSQGSMSPSSDVSKDESSTAEQAGSGGPTSDGSEDKVPAADETAAAPTVSMRAHVSNIGWQDPVSSNEKGTAYAGTVGKNLPVEAYSLSLNDAPEGLGVEYTAYVKGSGWQDAWASGADAFAGTTGKNLPIEAMKIRLIGELADQYDLYYSAHMSDIGWLGWAKNGDAAGVVGYGNVLQAFKVVIVKKGGTAPGSAGGAYKEHPADISTQAHVTDIGWMNAVDAGKVAGTTGKALTLQALKIALVNPGVSGGIEVRAHVRNIGWQSWTTGIAGTTGRNLPIEAMQIRLTGEAANKYDVYYRVHASDFGWLGWAKNGERAGSQGYAKSAEAVQVVLVGKGASAPGSTEDAFRAPMLVYSGHVTNIGWQGGKTGDAYPNVIIGTTGRGLSLQAFRLSSPLLGDDGGFTYSAHVENIGWQNPVSDGVAAGTTGRNLAIQAVTISLTGDAANKYDIWYRAHVAGYGWLDWTSNGQKAGSQGLNAAMEAVQIAMVAKGSAAPGSTATSFITKPEVSYSAQAAGKGWLGEVSTGAVSGTAGEARALEAFKLTYNGSIPGGLTYKAHVSDIGWMPSVSNGAVAGASGHQLQAMTISLTGEASKYFDVWYRVQVANFGWLGWTKNGSNAGSTNCNLQVEAYQVTFTMKDAPAPGSTASAYFSSPAQFPYIGYQNPWPYYQVSNKSVNIKNLGADITAYRTESRIPYNATRLTLINTMVTRAMEYLGTRYIWDYSSAPGVGVDCAGLVMQALYADGMDLAPFDPWDHYHTPGHDQYANGMWNSGRFLHVSTNNLQVGDLICYPGHIAIYIGGSKIIEAFPRAGVRISYSLDPAHLGIKGALRPIV